MDNPLQTLAPPKYEFRIFEHPQFGAIRIVIINGEIWFVAVDVCRALELGSVSKAIARLYENEKSFATIPTRSGEQKMLIVNEPGFYRLVMGSRKKEAVDFQNWVYHEVLPAIRESGIYTTPQMLAQFFESVANAETVYKCVYIHEMSNGRIKIGNAQDFLRRMRQIETGSGYTVVRSCRTDDLPEKEARKLERDCHESFADDRILGEYFSTPFEKACDELNRLARRNANKKLAAPPTK